MSDSAAAPARTARIGRGYSAVVAIADRLVVVRFVLVGVLNTIIGMSCVFAAMWWLKLDYRVANIVGYTIGCCVSFLFHRTWTFRYSGSWRGSFARWLGVVAVSYSLNLMTVVLLYQVFQLGADVAQIGGMVTYTGVSFLGGRWFAFRQTKGQSTKSAA